ncbi:hypothetical protein CWE08_04600 [Aliidiomarina iranensis]|uniref:Lipoprotein SmpA/OmlA domain-containing protein n=1 Tax=Aliidiomarina iranensis TaxID=1434071 RepID=A0A432W0P5_9GAMM|nr:hypothetical protein [Aliidiomarina iranensis]RUO22461.1 hypothetical protein CWE08_04600 [Aliidiomarina iranensis]
MAISRKVVLAGALAVLMSACASTENTSSTQRLETPPSLQNLSNATIGRFLIQNRTQVSDIQRWWGRPQAQGESGDIKWYNYTWLGSASGAQRSKDDAKMVTLTVYFMVDTGLLADYDLQVRDFSAGARNN